MFRIRIVWLSVILVVLIGRVVPTTRVVAQTEPFDIYVDSTVDADDTNPGDEICYATTNTIGHCTLRAAISEGNAYQGESDLVYIHVPTGSYNLDLTGRNEFDNHTGDINILNQFKSIVIEGEMTNYPVIDANQIDRVFYVRYGNVDVDMRYLVIQNGAMDSVNGQTSGAGILNESSLDLLGVVIRNNQVTCSNGIDCINQVGGGIKNFGILDLNNVTIQNNNAIRGGGLFNTGTNGVASIYNTTISGNLAQQSGGGVVNYATIGMVNSTISGNIGLDGVGGIHNDGIFYLGNVTIADNGTEGTINFVNVETALFRNTLITSTLGKTNCNLTHPITSDGYNLSSDNTCGFGAGPGDKINTNPRISLLGNWGGLYPAQVSLTHGLIAGSPVIDAGNINGCKGFNNDNLLTYDQRGQPRFPGRCDIGAFEGSLTQVFLPLVRR